MIQTSSENFEDFGTTTYLGILYVQIWNFIVRERIYSSTSEQLYNFAFHTDIGIKLVTLEKEFTLRLQNSYIIWYSIQILELYCWRNEGKKLAILPSQQTR